MMVFNTSDGFVVWNHWFPSSKSKSPGFINAKCLAIYEGSLDQLPLFPKRTLHPSSASWLVVSTHLKNISQIGNLPQLGVKIKNA